MNDLTAFLVAAVVILGTPGPTNTLLAAGGATLGVKKALPLLLGELAGYSISISAIRLVLQPLITTNPSIEIFIRVVMSAYLLFLSVRMWRRSFAPTEITLVSIRSVFITTLVNPKAILFAVGVFPINTDLRWHAASFAASTICVGFCWILIGCAIGASAGRHVRMVPRVAAVALAGFAVFVCASAFK